VSPVPLAPISAVVYLYSSLRMISTPIQTSEAEPLATYKSPLEVAAQPFNSAVFTEAVAEGEDVNLSAMTAPTTQTTAVKIPTTIDGFIEVEFILGFLQGSGRWEGSTHDRTRTRPSEDFSCQPGIRFPQNAGANNKSGR